MSIVSPGMRIVFIPLCDTTCMIGGKVMTNSVDFPQRSPGLKVQVCGYLTLSQRIFIKFSSLVKACDPTFVLYKSMSRKV